MPHCGESQGRRGKYGHDHNQSSMVALSLYQWTVVALRLLADRDFIGSFGVLFAEKSLANYTKMCSSTLDTALKGNYMKQ